MLKVRYVREEDCRLLWEWVNDPEVRASAFSSEPIAYEEHVDWFRKKRSDPHCTMYLLLDKQDSPLGQVRFDLKGDQSAEIDISIARSQRGKGIGGEAIKLAREELQRTVPVKRVVARIKPTNRASLRLFEKAGFHAEGRASVKGQKAVLMHWEDDRAIASGTD